MLTFEDAHTEPCGMGNTALRLRRSMTLHIALISSANTCLHVSAFQVHEPGEAIAMPPHCRFRQQPA